MIMLVRITYLPTRPAPWRPPEDEEMESSGQPLLTGSPGQLYEIQPRQHPENSTRALARANILIIKAQRQLTLFDGNTPLRQYPLGIGKPATPTPAGNFAIAVKVKNPGGALGSRWLGLNYDSIGIHGTNQPWLIGSMVSHGCIRMHNAHVEELFFLVNIGAPVYIRD